LYAPQKAFKEIIQKPGYLGPVILLVIFALAQFGAFYVLGSRTYIEQTMPLGDEGDQWTEKAALWEANSGVTISDNNAEFINGSIALPGFPDYYGNSSVEFVASDKNMLQMIVNDLGSQVNCNANGFQEVFFRIKIVFPEHNPVNTKITLYSITEANFFDYDLTNVFSDNSINSWKNISLPLGTEDWLSIGNPNWQNITGLSLEFVWSNNTNVDLLIDGLFFRGSYKNQLEIYDTMTLLTIALNGFVPFLFKWLLLTGMTYLLIKGLKGSVVWRPLMVAVGYALIVIVVETFLISAVYSTLPNLYYPLEILAFVPGESQAAIDALLVQIASANTALFAIQIAVYIWIVALGTFITRAITSNTQIAEQSGLGKTVSDLSTGEAVGFSWIKCLLVSVGSLLMTIIILGFLGV
jgi:hypothetical protein